MAAPCGRHCWCHPPLSCSGGWQGSGWQGQLTAAAPACPLRPPSPPQPLLQTLAEMRDSHYDPQTAKGEARGSRLSLHSAAKQTGSLE